jgi:hypothetical protein
MTPKTGASMGPLDRALRAAGPQAHGAASAAPFYGARIRGPQNRTWREEGGGGHLLSLAHGHRGVRTRSPGPHPLLTGSSPPWTHTTLAFFLLTCPTDPDTIINTDGALQKRLKDGHKHSVHKPHQPALLRELLDAIVYLNNNEKRVLWLNVDQSNTGVDASSACRAAAAAKKTKPYFRGLPFFPYSRNFDGSR